MTSYLKAPKPSAQAWKGIRTIRSDEPDPQGEPRRFVNAAGYVRLRWRVGPGQHLERYDRNPDGSLARVDPPAVKTFPEGRQRIDEEQAIALYRSGLSKRRRPESLDASRPRSFECSIAVA